MKPLPPSDELRALIAQSNDAVVPDDARARLAARLGPLFDAPPPPPQAPPGAGPGLRGGAWGLGTKWILLAGLGVGAVVVVTLALRASQTTTEGEPRVAVHVDSPPVVPSPAWTTVPPSRPLVADNAFPAPALEHAVITGPASPVVHASPPALASSPIGTPTASPVSSDELERERLLVDRARSALAEGDPAGALAAAGDHERAFPHGQLAEMREAIAVQALAARGTPDEARARARAFHATYPASVYAGVVDAAVGRLP